MSTNCAESIKMNLRVNSKLRKNSMHVHICTKKSFKSVFPALPTLPHKSKVIQQPGNGFPIPQASPAYHLFQFFLPKNPSLDLLVFFRLRFPLRQALRQQNVHPLLQEPWGREDIQENRESLCLVSRFLVYFRLRFPLRQALRQQNVHPLLQEPWGREDIQENRESLCLVSRFLV